MLNTSRVLLAGALALVACTICAAEPGDLQQQVFARERAFAKTMADRNFEAFKTFIAKDAIFFNGPNALRGREQVTQAWSGLYQGEKAPFSWDPDQVEVTASGDLALSTGPVFNPDGKCLGRFNSIWRLIDGDWYVVFDKGDDSCPPEPEPEPAE